MLKIGCNTVYCLIKIMHFKYYVYNIMLAYINIPVIVHPMNLHIVASVSVCLEYS